MSDEAPAVVGRPTEFSQEVADLICERLADGESLRTICKSDDLPDKATVFRWLAANEDFRDQYAYAREAQADAFADDLIDIADDGSNDWMERKNAEGVVVGWQENGEAIRRSALRIDARKWLAGKMKPKRYGDKTQMEHSGPDGQPIQVTRIELVPLGAMPGHDNSKG